MKPKNLINDKKLTKSYIWALLGCYGIVLIWALIFKCNMNSQLNINQNLAMSLWERFILRLIPFQELCNVIVQGNFWGYMAFIFNIICFIPVGLLLRLLTTKKNVYIICFAFVLCVESFQLFSAWGGFDMTDFIINLLGAFVGCRMYEWLYPKCSVKTINILLLSFLIPMIVFAVFVVIRTIIYFPV